MQDSSYPLLAKAALAVTLPPPLPPYTLHPPSHSARRKRRAASLTQPRTTSLLLSVDPSSDSFVDQERVEAAELVANYDFAAEKESLELLAFLRAASTGVEVEPGLGDGEPGEGEPQEVEVAKSSYTPALGKTRAKLRKALAKAHDTFDLLVAKAKGAAKEKEEEEEELSSRDAAERILAVAPAAPMHRVRGHNLSSTELDRQHAVDLLREELREYPEHELLPGVCEMYLVDADFDVDKAAAAYRREHRTTWVQAPLPEARVCDEEQDADAKEAPARGSASVVRFSYVPEPDEYNESHGVPRSFHAQPETDEPEPGPQPMSAAAMAKVRSTAAAVGSGAMNLTRSAALFTKSAASSLAGAIGWRSTSPGDDKT